MKRRLNHKSLSRCLFDLSHSSSSLTRRKFSVETVTAVNYPQDAGLPIPAKVLETRKRAYDKYTPAPMRSHSFHNYDPSDLLEKFSNRTKSVLDIQKLVNEGKSCTIDEDTLLNYSQFLHTELPIRLAQKVNELSNLPHGLSTMPSIKYIKKMYETSFKTLVSLEKPTNILLERKYTNHIKEIYEKHSGVLWTVARGVFQLKMKHSRSPELSKFLLEDTFPGIEQFLHNFFLSRLDIRMMIGQHIALHEHIQHWFGLFCLNTSITEISGSAIRAATSACSQYYGVAPHVSFVVENDNLLKPFTYIPAFLHHILFELLKNSMRATIEKHAITRSFTEASSFDFPDIKLVVKEDCIQIIDEGVGFSSQQNIEKAWSYMYTTASEEDCRHLFAQLERTLGKDFDSNEKGLPLAGLGFGLPIAKVFAQFLGGNITLQVDNNTTISTLYINNASIGQVS